MQTEALLATGFAFKSCDFCSQGPFVKAYACRSFVHLKGTPMAHARGEEWTACSDCAALIDQENWNALTERSVKSIARQYRISIGDVPALRDHIRDLHAAFCQYLICES
jgi:hypothetical protein